MNYIIQVKYIIYSYKSFYHQVQQKSNEILFLNEIMINILFKYKEDFKGNNLTEDDIYYHWSKQQIYDKFFFV